MDTFARISQPSALGGFMRHNGQGAGESFENAGLGGRRKPREASDRSEATGFAQLVERMLAG